MTYQAALTALLWSEIDDDGTPFDEIDAPISPALKTLLQEQWDAFRAAAEAVGFDAEEHRTGPCDPEQGGPWAYAAHDFILTRNGHGTGFWDSHRWQAPWGQRLTALAQWFGELHCYVSDAGEICAE
jgi:hypothetical protein